MRMRRIRRRALELDDADRTLEALLIDYQIARDDDRNSSQMLLNFLGIGITLLALLAAFISRACSADSWDNLQTFTQCDTAIPRPLFAFIPLAVAALLGWVAINGVTATEQSYYLRELELQILELLGDDREARRMRLPSYTNMTARFLSQTRGPLAARFLVFTMYITVGFLGLGIAAICILITQPFWFQVVASLVYLAVVAAIVRLTIIGSYSSSGTWRMMGPDLDAELQRTRERRIAAGQKPASSRPLVTYLLLPRPPEILMKSVFVAGGLLFSAVVFGEPSSRPLWVDLLLAIFILEYLVYQARYTLNDLAGAEGDAQHPGLAGGRFPTRNGQLSPTDASIALLVSAGRVALAFGLTITLFDGQQRGVLLAAIIAVGVLSVVYDRLRDRERRRHLSADFAGLTRSSLGSSAVFILVGSGYAVRVCSGLALGATSAPWLFLVVAFVSFWAFGIMFVTMTWAVDVVFYLGDADPDGGYPLSDQVREHPHYGPVARQAFTQPLSALNLSGVLSAGSAIPMDWRRRKDEPSPWHDLLRCKPLEHLRGGTWWSICLVVAAAGLAAMAGIVMQLGPGPTVFLSLGVAVITQALYALGRAVVLISIPFAGLGASLVVVDQPMPDVIAAWIPLAAGYATFLAFQRLDPKSQRARVRDWLAPLPTLVLTPVVLSVALLIGRNPWPSLKPPDWLKLPIWLSRLLRPDDPSETAGKEPTTTAAASEAKQEPPAAAGQSG